MFHRSYQAISHISHQIFLTNQTHVENIYFSSTWGGQQRRVLAIEGKTTGSKPRDLFLCVGYLMPLASSEVYERQSPGDSSELPGYLDASLLAQAKSTLLRDQLLRRLDDHTWWLARRSKLTDAK